MVLAKSALALAAAALTFGIMGGDGTHRPDAAPLSTSDLVIVQNDTKPTTPEQDSAKMGKEEGTHSGHDMGATKENDTEKVEQPERRNETSGGSTGQ